MKLSKLITAKGLIFLMIFSVLVFVGDRVNFSRLVGADSQFFTLFQLFGPIAGAFLGPVVGVLSVLIAEAASKIAAANSHSLAAVVKTFDIVTLLRLLPMLFAAWYFGTKKDKTSILVPIIAIALFVLHPVGRQVWYFSLFWTIPIIIKMLPKKYSQRVFLKSMGATFTAHAVGGAMWNYIVPMTPQMWIALIPIVIFERLVFTAGISISYVGVNNLLDKIKIKNKSDYVNVDKKYAMLRHSA